MKNELSYVSDSKWTNFALSAGFCLIIAISFVLVNQGIQDFEEEVKVEKLKNEDLEVKKSKIVEKCDFSLNYWAVSLFDMTESGSLRTMNRVFSRMKFNFANASHGDDWDFLWSIEHPFPKTGDPQNPLFAGTGMKKQFKIHQKANHFHGIEALISKTHMSRLNRDSEFILPFFLLPYDQEKLNKFLNENPTKFLLEKHHHNRGVKIVQPKEVKNATENKVFYQQFMDDPFLIDNYAFDFGVFVLITSFDPLRIYRFDTDVLLRFCAEKYHPFDPKNTQKYVIADNSQAPYEMPTFRQNYQKFGFPPKIIFERHIEALGHNLKDFWQRIDAAIVKVVLNAENHVVQKLKAHQLSSHNFFEVVRFDLVLDSALNPYVLEVNMSPNLSPAAEKYEENSLIYEQLVYNTIKMVGGANIHEFWARFDSTDILVSNKKNLAVGLKTCLKHDCINNCNKSVCAICEPCITSADRFQMREAFREHQHEDNFRRIFPTTKYTKNEKFTQTMTRANQVSLQWFEGQCESDTRWC